MSRGERKNEKVDFLWLLNLECSYFPVSENRILKKKETNRVNLLLNLVKIRKLLVEKKIKEKLSSAAF